MSYNYDAANSFTLGGVSLPFSIEIEVFFNIYQKQNSRGKPIWYHEWMLYAHVVYLNGSEKDPIFIRQRGYLSKATKRLLKAVQADNRSELGNRNLLPLDSFSDTIPPAIFTLRWVAEGLAAIATHIMDSSVLMPEQRAHLRKYLLNEQDFK